MSELTLDTKTANTKYDINPLIKNRWSPRAFTSRVPDKEQLEKLFDAARWAPSSYNEQPWRFIIGVKNDESQYNKIYDCLNEFNQEWASSAPVLLLVCSRTKFTRNDKVNKHCMYDCGASMAMLSVQATEDNLYVHQMAGFDPELAREKFNVPEEFEIFTAAAIGYLGDPDQLNDKQKQTELSERSRKGLSEIVFSGSWGDSYVND